MLQKKIDYYSEISPKIIDLSSDFRLNTPTNYEKWYGDAHLAPDWLPRFVYGLPEIYRKEISNTQYVSGVGCNATASILALLPLIKHDLLITDRPIIAEIKTGSSEGGSKANPGSHHPVRSGSVRSYASVGHRHTAEIQQVLGVEDLHIWQNGRQLFMVAEVSENFDFEAGLGAYLDLSPRCREWEGIMAGFQEAPPNAPPGEKWVPLDRIYSFPGQDS